MSSTDGGVPRWVEIPFGLFLLVVLFFCAIGSATLVVAPPDKNPPLAMAVGSIMVLLTLWGVEKSVRLISGRPTHGGLMGPISLYFCAMFFLVMPVIALVSGHLQKQGILVWLQAVAYPFIAFGLFRLARERSDTKLVAPGDVPKSGAPLS